MENLKEVLKECIRKPKLKRTQRLKESNELKEAIQKQYSLYRREISNFLEEIENKYGTLIIDRDEVEHNYLIRVFFLSEHKDKNKYYISLFLEGNDNITISLDELFDLELAKKSLIKKILSEEYWIKEDIQSLEEKISEYNKIIENIKKLKEDYEK